MAMAIKKLSFPTRICSELSNNNNEKGSSERKKPAITISTNPSHIRINTLSQLYTSCDHSPYRLPSSSSAVDTGKLAVAVANSSVVVSVFASALEDEESDREKGLFGRILPAPVRVSPEDGVLVGFGRAVSDLALTAAVYDVMVIPSLRRMGFGRMIVQRIIRMLANRGIYDISALCCEEERLFFAACGFGDDLLGSTTMMYTQIPPADHDPADRLTVPAGRKLLVRPPSRLPYPS